MTHSATLTRHEIRYAPMISCDFCGTRFRIFSGHSVGSSATLDCCPDCYRRIALCKRCEGRGTDPSVMAGAECLGDEADYCSRCDGEGIEPHAPCQFIGRVSGHDPGTCHQCDVRSTRNRDWDAEREGK